MAISIGTLTLELEALTTSFSKDMAGVTKSLDQAARAIGRVGDAAGAGAAALVSLGSDAVGVAGDFEAAMTKAAIVTDNLGVAGEENFGRLEDAARSAASVTEFTATESAKAIELMGQAGFDTAEILEGLPKVLQLASAASVSVAKATDTAANTISAFGLSVEDDLSRVNDVFVTTANSANTNFTLLSSSMKQVAPIARSIGMEIEDTAALLGKLADNGIKGAKAGTGLSGVFASMLNPSKEVKKTIDQLGLSFTDEKGKLKDFSQIMDDMGPIANDTGALFKIFGRRGGPTMAALLNTGTEAVEELADKLRNNAGAAAMAAEANMATFQGRMAQLNSKIEGAQIIIGDLAKDALLPLVAVLDDVVQAFIDLPDWVQTSMVAIAAAAAAVLTLVAAFAGLVATIAGVVGAIAALTAVKATLAAIAGIVAAVGIVVGAIGAGILGAISILNQLHNIWLFFESDIKRGVSDIGSAMASFFDPAIDALMDAFGAFADWWLGLWGDMIGAGVAVAVTAWDFITAVFRENFGEAFDWLDSQFTSTANSALDVFGSLLDIVSGLIMAIIPDAWVSAFNDARVAFPDFLTELEIAGKNIIKVLTAAFAAAFDGVKAALQTILDILAAAAGFGLEVTGTQAGGEQQASGGFFANIGKDLVQSLGFEDVADASEQLSNALASAKKEVEKSAARPRKRTVAAIEAAEAAGKAADRAASKQKRANAKFDKLNDDRAKDADKARAKEDARFAKQEQQADKDAADAAGLRDKQRKAADDAINAQKNVFDRWVAGLTSSLIGSLGEMGTVISAAIEGFQAGNIWGAVIGVILELAKRTDGFQESVEDLNLVFDSMVEAIGPLTAALVPLTMFINDILVDVFKALGFVFRIVGFVLLSFITGILGIFKGLADLWNFAIGKLEDFLSVFDVDLGRLKIQTGGLEDALDKAGESLLDLRFGTEAVTEEQAQETDQLRALNEQLLNAPEGFKVSLERFNATVRDGAAISAGGGGGIFGAGQIADTASAGAGGDVNIDSVTVVANDPEDIFEAFAEMTKWKKLKSTGTSRPTGNAFASGSEQRFSSG